MLVLVLFIAGMLMMVAEGLWITNPPPRRVHLGWLGAAVIALAYLIWMGKTMLDH